MASVFKNIKSLFVVPEETTAATAEEKAGTPEAKQEPASPRQPTPSGQAGPGKVTQQFTEVLFNAMEANNLEGFDYLEFKQSLRSLEKMPMDEPTRFRSAFAMAQTMGATPEKLVQAAQHYAAVLKEEERKFEEALAHQQTKQIGAKAGQIKDLDTIIQQKTEQIKKLTQEIEQHRAQQAQLQQEVADASGKVEATKNNFIASYNAVAHQITDDIEKMKQFLK